jgi:hypothetical protein
VSARCIIPNPDFFSSRETGVDPGIKSWKCPYLKEIDVRMPLMVSTSQITEDELRLYNLV